MPEKDPDEDMKRQRELNGYRRLMVCQDELASDLIDYDVKQHSLINITANAGYSVEQLKERQVTGEMSGILNEIALNANQLQIATS